VWEWCEDWVNATKVERVLRGGSWLYDERVRLTSSYRHHRDPGFRHISHGFRCVVVNGKSGNELGAPTKPALINQTIVPPSRILPGQPFTNTLGMKFVPVPGTEVFFCIHETRRQDYAAYAAEIPGVDGTWKNQQKEGIPVGDKDDHPVVGMSWEDAQKFCAWLSKKEGKTYRLPTDQEWSFAVGIGNEEKWTKDTTPEMLHGKVTNKFPWGGDFPPKATDQAGNYADTMCKEKFPSMPFIEGYMDNFATTAPVMSFKPNKLGIYDLGGNVWEWCEDWFNALNVEHVLRGGSWGDYGRAFPLSSFRFHGTPGSRRWSCGFRCVLVVKR
jgi:formylglycine-generating enzyme required for sulfatase activity